LVERLRYLSTKEAIGPKGFSPSVALLEAALAVFLSTAYRDMLAGRRRHAWTRLQTAFRLNGREKRGQGGMKGFWKYSKVL